MSRSIASATLGVHAYRRGAWEHVLYLSGGDDGERLVRLSLLMVYLFMYLVLIRSAFQLFRAPQPRSRGRGGTVPGIHFVFVLFVPVPMSVCLFTGMSSRLTTVS